MVEAPGRSHAGRGLNGEVVLAFSRKEFCHVPRSFQSPTPVHDDSDLAGHFGQQPREEVARGLRLNFVGRIALQVLLQRREAISMEV